jgi:hypothetical protein
MNTDLSHACRLPCVHAVFYHSFVHRVVANKSAFSPGFTKPLACCLSFPAASAHAWPAHHSILRCMIGKSISTPARPMHVMFTLHILSHPFAHSCSSRQP